MSSEREAVVSAINTSPNLGVAARRLGASRRTLQNRMRFYGLPRGHSGRPKQALPKRGGGVSAIGATDLLLLGGVGAAFYFAGRWLRGKETIVGADAGSRYVTGMLALAL